MKTCKLNPHDQGLRRLAPRGRYHVKSAASSVYGFARQPRLTICIQSPPPPHFSPVKGDDSTPSPSLTNLAKACRGAGRTLTCATGTSCREVKHSPQDPIQSQLSVGLNPQSYAC